MGFAKLNLFSLFVMAHGTSTDLPRCTKAKPGHGDPQLDPYGYYYGEYQAWSGDYWKGYNSCDSTYWDDDGLRYTYTCDESPPEGSSAYPAQPNNATCHRCGACVQPDPPSPPVPPLPPPSPSPPLPPPQPPQPPPPPRHDDLYIPVTFGQAYELTAAVRSDGSLEVWGDTYYGPLPTFTEMNSFRWKHVRAGNSHLTGITTTGRWFIWSSSWVHEVLSDGTTSAISTTNSDPISTTGVWTFAEIGSCSVCGLKTDGDMVCLEYDSMNAGFCTVYAHAILPPSGYKWSTMSLGWYNHCGITADAYAVVCWGRDTPGGILDHDSGFNLDTLTFTNTIRSAQDEFVVVTRKDNKQFKQVSVGNRFLAVLTTDGELSMWGEATDEYHKGGGEFQNRWSTLPTLESSTRYHMVSVGNNKMCAILEGDRTVECYPANHETGDMSGSHNGVYPRDTQVTSLETNWQGSVAITTYGEIIGWGQTSHPPHDYGWAINTSHFPLESLSLSPSPPPPSPSPPSPSPPTVVD